MIRVHIRENWGADKLDVYVVRAGDNDAWLLQTETVADWGPQQKWVQLQPDIPTTDSQPSFTIPAETAHAVLGALARHLGAVEHPEQLRRDYEAERKRVDKFIDHALEAKGG